MKNLLLILLLLVFKIQLYAQTNEFDSTKAISKSSNVSSEAEQIDMSRKPTLKSIKVKAGDSVAISVRMQMEKPPKGNFLKSIARAMTPYFLFKQTEVKTSFTEFDQRKGNSLFGAGVSIIPGAIGLTTKNTSKKMPSVSIESYDSVGTFISKQQTFATKEAFKDWEEIVVSYKVIQDGTVDLSTNSGSNLSYEVDKRTFYATTITESVSSPAGSNSAERKSSQSFFGPKDPPTTNLEGECIGLFLVEYENGQEIRRTLVSVSCPPPIPSTGGGTGGGQGGDGSGGGGGTIDPTSDCVKCKRLAKHTVDLAQVAYYAARDKFASDRAQAESDFNTGLLACGGGAITLAWTVTQGVGAWTLFIPGIGTLTAATIAGAAAVGGTAFCCYKITTAYDNKMVQIQSDIANAEAAWAAARENYISTIDGCGTCNF